MNNPFGWIGVTVAILAASVVVVLGLCCYQPIPLISSPINAPSTAVLSYQDSCVVSITHPELEIRLADIVRAGNGCNCQYWFSVKNKTANIGTKAYRVVIQPILQENASWNDDSAEMRHIYGKDAISQINYPNLQNEVRFSVSGSCPDCFSYQAGPYSYNGKLIFLMSYIDCSGTRNYRIQYDLSSQRITMDLTSANSSSGCP